MIPWVLLDTAQVPGDGGELRLMQRGAEFSIRLGHNELMNSRLGGSEEALATLACEKIRSHNAPRILIGGLGMGFTLRAALGAVGADATVVVAELVPAVVAWARGPMAEVFGQSLADPRVSVREADVRHSISKPAAFDAILLDVDNGPDAFTAPGNANLYGSRGLERARTALVPGGRLGVWSVADDRAFMGRLTGVGFAVERHKIAPHPGSGARHIVWIGRAP